MSISVKIELLGGLHILTEPPTRELKLSLPEGSTIKELIEEIRCNVIANPKDIEVFIEDGTVRAGILVLINDSDWELEGEESYELESGDLVSFTSTLHGG